MIKEIAVHASLVKDREDFPVTSISMACVDLGKKKSVFVFGLFSIPWFVYLSFCFISCLCYVVVFMFPCLS